MNIVLATLSVCAAVVTVWSGTWNQSASLMSDLLSTYDRRLRPVNNQSKPIRVYLTFDLVSIQYFSEVEGKLSLVGLMYLVWYDEKLSWKPSRDNSSNIRTLMFPLNDVWHPTIVLANSYNEIKDVRADWMMVEYNANGRAMYVPGDVFTVSCLADVTYYPFDYQTCHIIFVSWGFTSGKVSLTHWGNTVLKTYFTENGEWILERVFPSSISGETSDDVDYVVITIVMKRRSTFLLVNVILPVVFMSLINILVFVLPTESGERVSYAITVLLSLAIFLTLVVNNLPRTSQPMAFLCYYFMFTLVTSVLMCVVTILNMRLFYVSDRVTVPQWCKRLMTCSRRCHIPVHVQATDEKGGKTDEHANGAMRATALDEITWRDVSRTIDRFCLIIFVIVLITINVIYLNVLSNNGQ